MSTEKKKSFFKSLSFQIYFCFLIMILIVCAMVGFIFMSLYQKSYRDSYTERLKSQGETIAKNIKKISKNESDKKYTNYMSYIEEIMEAEGLDVWIVANQGANKPLQEKYENINLQDVELTEEIKGCLDNAFSGEISTSSSYDKIYGADIIQVAVPIRLSDEVIGSVLMTAMIYRQTMSINKGRYIISVSILIALAVSVIIAMLVTRVLSKTTAKISSRIHRLEEGDYSITKVKRANWEIGQIEEALNQLSVRLGSIEKEQAALEQARLDFFANVSHELRTPITVVNGYTESLVDGVISEDAKKQELYSRMQAECKGMERLVEDLFLLSKMQNPDFEVEKEPISLIQIFEEIVRSAKVIAKEKNIKLRLNHGEDPCVMLGDYDRIKQMFMVIIDNAIKFSNTGGRVEITIKAAKKLTIVIADYGCGIKDEELPYIFEKFYKSKLRQNSKGTGLGLMIAKQIALKHNGNISVISQEGKGTQFAFQFDKIQNLEDYE